MVSTLTELVNTHVEAAFRERSRGSEHVKAEILRLEREAGNLVRFLAEGGESATVRSELQGIERALQGLAVWTWPAARRCRRSSTRGAPDVDAGQARAPRRAPEAGAGPAKAEIAKHLHGELTVRPLPSTGRERRAEISGRPNRTASWNDRRLFAVGAVAVAREHEPDRAAGLLRMMSYPAPRASPPGSENRSGAREFSR